MDIETPHASYSEFRSVWEINRAMISGERKVKEYDLQHNRKLLIPFSPTMTMEQYLFFLSEAELPGICSEYVKMLVGGLLRKQPVLELPPAAPAESYSWIMNEFGQDDSTLVSFLAEALVEEVQTGRAWVFVDYPNEDFEGAKPYPVLYPAETVINWRVENRVLNRVVVRKTEEDFSKNEFHPEMKTVIYVHELNEEGYYQVRKFVDKREVETYDFIVNGERLSFLPIYPLNGSVELDEPLISTLVNKETSLYNKVSRRNHLLYGASTYTPIIYSDMPEDDFEKIVSGGLGTWIRLRSEDRADVLKTPTDALADMEKAIAAGVEEMARLGVRMMAPETSQSGVALQLRNATQIAQLGSLNSKVSSTISAVITFMLNWRYGTSFESSDVHFTLSHDFAPQPLGEGWLRLATEWYKEGLIPRSVWMALLKKNDMVNPDYDDEEGQKEITEGQELLAPKVNEDYARNFMNER
jgi:hypothetical protein